VTICERVLDLAKALVAWADIGPMHCASPTFANQSCNVCECEKKWHLAVERQAAPIRE